MEHPMVDIIIVSWGHASYMDALFASLAKLDYPRDRWRLHVVINKDGDGTKEKVEGWKGGRVGPAFAEATAGGGGERGMPEIIIHEPHANLGFAGGNNLAMIWAMRHNSEFVYLLNPDTEIMPDALAQAVKVALEQKDVGTVQSLLLRGDHPDQINSRGNALHYLGFGYCMGDHDPVSSAPAEPVDIPYPSGAGVLIPVTTFESIGLLDEYLHSYHEDLDLGWRVTLAGKRNYLAPASRVVHHYEFSRSISKWRLMERNRWLVVFKNYKLATLIALLPALVSTDMAIWAFAVKGGWLKQKFLANLALLKPGTWKYLLAGREQTARIRQVPDWYVFRRMTYKIEYQELKSGWAEKIANPFWQAMYSSYLFIVRW